MIGRKGPDVPDYPVKVPARSRRLILGFVAVVGVYTVILTVILISALTVGVRP